MRTWKTEDSAEMYNIHRWGLDYFGINKKGHVFARPKKDGPEIDLHELLDELSLRDVSTPLLLRFPDILEDRIQKISECFSIAREAYNLNSGNVIVYPIKVNQMRPVVEEIIRQSGKYSLGLEAGSKPELHAVLASGNDDSGIIICNGYKDEDYIELALLATKMGKRVFIVVEKLNELKLIIQLARKHKVTPLIGIRVKLASSGSGKWEDSGGDKSKFGLTASELIDAVEIADDEKMLDNIKLIHFHLGSQITNIRKIKVALIEAAQFFVQMRKLGCGIEYFDVGGGLGVDYDGFRSIGANSINYSIQEYVNDVVASIVEACDNNQLTHPVIVTESGRALTAHHSVLVFDVLETTTPASWDKSVEIGEEEHELLIELYEIYMNLSQTGMFEAWHDALIIREESLERFSLGLLDLRTRAMIERLFWTTASEIHSMSQDLKHQPSEFRRLSQMLADKYFCNFSLFQSLPDSWAIDQIFPVIPIQNLDKEPEKRVTLQDLTCDSDGKINHFIGLGSSSYSLPVHTINTNKPYYLAVFLVGAYQEILGDLHNLFGDTNAVHISINGDSYEINQVIDGETVSDVLSYVQFDSKKMVRAIEKWVSLSVKNGKISAAEGKEFLATYRSGLYGYTYLA